jgi:hypothetical protein
MIQITESVILIGQNTGLIDFMLLVGEIVQWTVGQAEGIIANRLNRLVFSLS